MRASIRGSIRSEIVVDSLWSAPAVDCSISFASSRCIIQNFASSCSQANAGIASHCATMSMSNPFPDRLSHAEIAENAESYSLCHAEIAENAESYSLCHAEIAENAESY